MAWDSGRGTPGPIQTEMGLGIGVALMVGVEVAVGKGVAVGGDVGVEEGTRVGDRVGVPVRMRGNTRDGAGVVVARDPPLHPKTRHSNRPVVASATKRNFKGRTIVLL
jgi:hypothetical protein